MSETSANTIKDLSFEAALKELETIVQSLESGQADLEKSITLYERGTALRQHCEAKLADAQAKVEKITLTPEGNIKTESLDG